MSMRKAQHLLGKDSQDLVDWTKYGLESAKNFSQNLDFIREHLAAPERAKMAGITKKQFDSLSDVQEDLKEIQARMTHISKRITTVAKRLNPETGKAA